MAVRLVKIFLVLFILVFSGILPARAAGVSQTGSNLLVWGRVTQIVSETQTVDQHSKVKIIDQIVRIRLISGKLKYREITVKNMIGLNPVFDIKVVKGDGVIVAYDLENGDIKNAGIVDHLREPWIYTLIALFVVLLLLVCWKKGLKALITLIFTLGVILGLLLPGFLKGYDPLLMTVTAGIVIAVINTLVIGGLTRKSLASIGGTIGGLVVAGAIALTIGKAAHLTGFGNEESAMLLYLPQKIHLNIQGLLFAGIIIGALGAVMDVGMSVASAVEEVKKANPNLKVGELIQAGMNVGRDITGIMANTLILAYTGGSMSLLLMFMAYRDSMTLIMNLDMIASEIVRALSGSIGMIIVVPFTAVIAGYLFGGEFKQKKLAQPDQVSVEEEYNFIENWSRK